MFVVKNLAFLVLCAIHAVHATTVPSADVKGPSNPGFPGIPGFPGFPFPPEHPSHHPTPSKPTPTHKTSHTTSSAVTSTAFVFSTPPASLHAPATFTAGEFFSVDFLKNFYPGFGPSQTSVEPQPVITDPVDKSVFPLDLTNPKTIPNENDVDPVVIPPSLLLDSPTVISATANLSTPGSIKLRELALKDISAILQNTTGSFSSSCGQCVSSLAIMKQLALSAPWEVPKLIVSICEISGATSFGGCDAEFSQNSDGGVLAQIVANADVTGADGQYLCARGAFPLNKRCPLPAPVDLTEILKTWFAKPKPKNAVAPKPSGKEPIYAIHLSDIHLDARYTIGSEAQCDQFLCCRPDSNTSAVPPGQILLPAPRFGAYECDSPWLLVNALFHAVGTLTGTNPTNPEAPKPISFNIFTGDLTSHDNDNQLGRSYVKYVETAVYSLFKKYLSGPTFATLGNHDTWVQAYDAPHSLNPETLANQFEWNYGHLADLWQLEGWLDGKAANTAKSMYAAYSILTPQNLKIISLNTDLWYVDNNFNFINASNPDTSGMLRFLTDELQAAEDAGQRVWIIGHVLTGWDGSAATSNPPNLFYQIVDRFSPHVIANIFMGHVHDETRYIYYANNGTVMNAQTAVATTWVGGSVTPLAGLNSGFSMYAVDPETFDIMDAYVWYANVSSFSEADRLHEGIKYVFGYSTREVYGSDFDWPTTAPLNASWWHHVTESMETNPSLVEAFTRNQGRQSPLTQNCTSTECQEAKICYIRSGSPPLSARCQSGFGSVQQ